MAGTSEPATIASLEAENARLATALVFSDTRHRRLLESCPLPVYSIDAAGVVLEANLAAAELSGRSVDDLIGSSLLQIVAAEDLKFARHQMQGTLKGQDAPTDFECRIVRPTGERRVVQVTRAPLERDGRIVGVQGIARDVTEERSREAQLRRAERMASVAPLLSGVCHELNNPLTSIKSFAELMLLDNRPEEDREALEIVAREAGRAARIVSDLRVVARQTQEATSSSALVNLAEVVERVLDSRRESFETSSIEVRRDLAADAPAAWAVPAQIEQVVAHLLTNAIQAVRDQPAARVISVSSYRSDLGVALQVSDTGPGIRAEDIDRIFDPFWTTRTPGEGTGLGLSLVHRIVTDHCGRIRVDGNPGSGARFTVEFPAAEKARARMDLGTSHVPARQSLRVLIVDDEAPSHSSLTRYLERRGHIVKQAADEATVLELLGPPNGKVPFDVILADLRTGLDGLQLVARLRERPDELQDRVIFMTSDPESSPVEHFLEDCDAPRIGRPFELAEVAQIIEAHAGMFLR